MLKLPNANNTISEELNLCLAEPCTSLIYPRKMYISNCIYFYTIIYALTFSFLVTAFKLITLCVMSLFSILIDYRRKLHYKNSLQEKYKDVHLNIRNFTLRQKLIISVRHLLLYGSFISHAKTTDDATLNKG